MKKFPNWLFIAITLLISVCAAIVSHFLEPFGKIQLWPLYAMTFFAGFVFAAFVLICFLKREFRFIPNMFITVFVFMFILSNTVQMYLEQYTPLAFSFEYACIGMIAIGMALSTERSLWKIPVRIPLLGVAIVTPILSFLCPLIPAATTALKIILYVLYGIIIAGTLLSSVFSTLKRKDPELYVNPVIACVLIVMYVYCHSPYVNTSSPDYVLCILILAVTLAISVKELILLERKASYLTKNMQSEIIRQTEELRTASDNNKKIIYTLSHNLKKSVISVRRFTKVAQEREKDEEQAQLLNILFEKTCSLEAELDELTTHARHNYNWDSSEVFCLKDAIEEVYQSLCSDCEANGIIFTVKVPKCKIFGSKKDFADALIALLVNAISHDDCKMITISVRTKLAKCIITLTDDCGWVNTADDAQGWNICKKTVMLLHGSMAYTSRHDVNVVEITLPLV